MRGRMAAVTFCACESLTFSQQVYLFLTSAEDGVVNVMGYLFAYFRNKTYAATF